MELAIIIFYCFFGLTIASAAIIIFTKNILYAAFSLMVTLIGVASIYIFARADFIAVTQVLVYIGGILILIIFGVMLTNKSSGKAIIAGHHYKISGTLIGLGTLTLLLSAIFSTSFYELAWIQSALDHQQTVSDSTLGLIGVKLMSDFVLPFELAAIILLIALIGSAFIAKQNIE